MAACARTLCVLFGLALAQATTAGAGDPAPSGELPSPVARGDARAPQEPLACPPGAGRVVEEETLGAGDVFRALDDGNPQEPADLLLRSALNHVLNLVRLPFLRVEARTTGLLRPKKDGPAVVWTPDGRRAGDGRYRDDRRDGVWTCWNSDGSRAGETTYRDGRLHGRDVSWHDLDGPTAAVRHYRDGALHGPFAQWHPNGTYVVTGSYQDGRKQGIWTSYYVDGSVLEQGSYLDDEMHGTWTHRLESGRIAWEREFRGGEMIHERVESGRSGGYRNGKRQGLWTETSAGRKRSEGHYEEGRPHGAWRYYHSSGSLRAEGRIENERRVGRWVEYHPNGARSAEGDYLWCETPPDREVTLLPPDGPLVARLPAPGRRRDADFEVTGCRVGTWTFWGEDGTLRGHLELDERAAAVAPQDWR
jgi:antitoxin component YwqK of YwqJK toxin-antitoxin module